MSTFGNMRFRPPPRDPLPALTSLSKEPEARFGFKKEGALAS